MQKTKTKRPPSRKALTEAIWEEYFTKACPRVHGPTLTWSAAEIAAATKNSKAA